MAVAVSYPGVYIDEFAPGGPIPAASTSIAAILGPLARGPVVGRKGPIKEPPKITSWDQFRATFGYRPAPGFFTWYAARGFFENGGTACYVSRVTNAEYASSELLNAAGQVLADVYASEPGALGTAIDFVVLPPPTPLLPAGTTLFAASVSGATIHGSEVNITANTAVRSGNPADARLFRVGDWVVIEKDGAPLGKPARVRSSTTGGLVLDERYGNVDDAVVRLVYIPGGDLRVRVPVPDDQIPPNALAIGTLLQLTVPGEPVNTQVIDAARAEQLTSDFRTYRLTPRDGVPKQINPAAGVPVTTLTFHVEIAQGGSPLRFTHLSSDPASDRYYVAAINNARHLVRVVPREPAPLVPGPEGLVPAPGAGASVTGGTDEVLPELVDGEFVTALEDLRRVGDVRLVCVPDGYPRRATDPKPHLTSAVQAAVVAHCEQMGDRFGVIDPAPGLPLFGADSVETARGSLDSARGYAALYYPWVRVAPAGKGPPLLVPPSGHVCGLMAYVDAKKGVFKAPANEILQGTTGVERGMTEAEHGLLNLQGVNVIRVFRDGGRPYVYGARTTATDTNWKYVNVRRLFLFLEKSIQDGIRWSVFEPSNKNLWDKLRQSINGFLATQWKAGALFGASPKEAYYVRIDEALNPFEEQRNGRLNIEIGIRPTYTAEFIIVRIGIWDGGSSASEG